MAEFRLSYTAQEINEKLGKISNLSWNDLNWETVETIEILPEQDVNFSYDADDAYLTALPIDIQLINNWNSGFDSAIVNWNGNIYECELIKTELFNGIGNTEEVENSPFPFAMAAVSKTLAGIDGLLIIDVASTLEARENGGGTDITNRISVSIKRSTIKKIDEKFISFEREIDILPLQDLQEMAYSNTYGCFETTLIAPANLMLGETYVVYWDGTRYECVCHDGSSLMEGAVFIGNGLPFGLPNNNEPFIIGTPEDKSGFMFLSMTDTEPTVHSARIYKVENIIDARIDAYMEKALGGDY